MFRLAPRKFPILFLCCALLLPAPSWAHLGDLDRVPPGAEEVEEVVVVVPAKEDVPLSKEEQAELAHAIHESMEDPVYDGRRWYRRFTDPRYLWKLATSKLNPIRFVLARKREYAVRKGDMRTADLAFNAILMFTITHGIESYGGAWAVEEAANPAFVSNAWARAALGFGGFLIMLPTGIFDFLCLIGQYLVTRFPRTVNAAFWFPRWATFSIFGPIARTRGAQAAYRVGHWLLFETEDGGKFVQQALASEVPGRYQWNVHEGKFSVSISRKDGTEAASYVLALEEKGMRLEQITFPPLSTRQKSDRALLNSSMRFLGMNLRLAAVEAWDATFAGMADKLSERAFVTKIEEVGGRPTVHFHPVAIRRGQPGEFRAWTCAKWFAKQWGSPKLFPPGVAEGMTYIK